MARFLHNLASLPWVSYQKRAELNTHRIAQGVIDWIQSEVLAELDASNHYHLASNYPSETTREEGESNTVHEVDEDTTVTPGELSHKLGGEDFDSDEGEEDDYTAPTEKQKREIMKIHRGLGHPTCGNEATPGALGC